MLVNLDLYLRTEDGKYVNMYWSDNPPCEPETATAVIGANVFAEDGTELDGGELDIQGTIFDLRLYAREMLEFLGICPRYVEITEDEFCEVGY